MIGKETVVVVVVFLGSTFVVVVVVTTFLVVVEVVVVPPIVIEPSTSLTLEEMFTPFSALTTVSAHLTGNVPVVPAGISNISVANTSPSLAVAPFTAAKR